MVSCVGAVLGISVILHSISFALLILWIGGLGSFTSFHLIKWRLNTTSQLCTSTPISKCQPHKSIPDIDSKAKESGEVCIACKKSGCHLHV
ncbi:hypothetical protein EB796_003610 [Bugula neritina]|uniref:Uncharacterized protein n=1 Tax=Bugula neritina TaxID=10212 RepID=A0A7J7KL07_BUGNE|nr:hypothetical protein EB796_003610 [Bugula neritina]